MFYLALALRLGRSVRELLATVSSEELTEWRAFDRISPIGDWRMDFGLGMVSATLANVNRGKDTEPFRPLDFMPLVEAEEKPKPTLAEQLRGALMAAHAARAKKKEAR